MGHADTHQQAEMFASIFEELPALVCLLLPVGGVMLANRRCREFFGATLDEMKTWQIKDVVHPDDLEKVVAAWNRAVETGDSYEVDGRHRRCDGVYRWLHMSGNAMRDSEGCIVFWCLVQTDIEERKKAERLLAGEKRLLETVASDIPLSESLSRLCVVVEEFFDNSYCGMLFPGSDGATWRHAVGPSLPFDYNHGMEGRPAHAESGPCGMAASSKAQVIVHNVATDERWKPHGWRALALAHGLQSCWSVPIVSRANQTMGSLAIYRRDPGSPTQFQCDLIDKVVHIVSIAVERAQHDAALKQSEAFLAQAQRISATGGFSWHTVTDKVTWSEQVYRIFEFDPSVPVTLEAIIARLHPEDVPSFSKMLMTQRRYGGDFEHEHRLLMPDGSIKHLHVFARDARDQNGQLEYIAAVQDVTQRKISEEALGKIRSELSHMARVITLNTLTASIAHEVNQPLSGIITNASACLRMLGADPPNINGAIETARRSIRDGNRAADVIARLRALVKKEEAPTEFVDLNDATKEVIVLTRAELQQSRVVLKTELADDLPPVMSDRVQLQQVILNLLLNAADAVSKVNDRPREVVIITQRDESDHVRLAVQDVGIGFDPHELDKLFVPFYTTKSSGMGIGLSISRTIIESHHGRIWATLNEGPGATFVFAIPRVPAGMANAV